jgi:hypothetical protein
VAYFVRVFAAGGWYIVTYTLGIYLLNLLLAFLSPKFDPAGEEEGASDGLADVATGGANSPSLLPTAGNQEFRPFIRRLPEFKFWYFSTRAFTIAFVCAWIKAFDVPAFWPILLVYWIMLFALTMRRQILHMIKHKYVACLPPIRCLLVINTPRNLHRYVPWDYGKGSGKVAK